MGRLSKHIHRFPVPDEPRKWVEVTCVDCGWKTWARVVQKPENSKYLLHEVWGRPLWLTGFRT